mmetsp:Transcript_15270/g.30894  ORF Transcript_15270/g.30894 Transcript_15270/m.30894 type:complete len:203 (-) Transcript_15270:34-642(-)
MKAWEQHNAEHRPRGDLLDDGVLRFALDLLQQSVGVESAGPIHCPYGVARICLRGPHADLFLLRLASQTHQLVRLRASRVVALGRLCLGPPIADDQRGDRSAILEVGGSHLTTGGCRQLHPKGDPLPDDVLPQELASCPRERLVRRTVAVTQTRRCHAGQRDLLLWWRPLARVSTHDEERVATEYTLDDATEHGWLAHFVLP